jgi:hypothetical protein
MLGSFLRVFGLSIAARIGNVYWRVDEPRISAHKRAESVKLPCFYCITALLIHIL